MRITLSENGHVVTVASADAMARLLDKQQYELDTGPCLEALRTARVITADDLITENRVFPRPPGSGSPFHLGIERAPLVMC